VVAELEPLLLTDAVKAGLVRLGAQHVRGLKLLQVRKLLPWMRATDVPPPRSVVEHNSAPVMACRGNAIVMDLFEFWSA
jgi:hypothetical protein